MKKNYITPMTKTKNVDTINILSGSNATMDGAVNITDGSDSGSSSVIGDGVGFGGKADDDMAADSKRQTIWDEEE